MSEQKSIAENQWDTSLYEKHAFVWQYGSNLIEILSPKKGEFILDLGCGTGQLTNKIAATGAKVIGIDKSPIMIAQASKNYPGLQWQVADGTNFTFTEVFDAVFSNAALHWIKPPEAVISCIWQALKPGSRLVAEFGGKGNVELIISAIDAVIKETGSQVNLEQINPWYFPSIGEYATLLEQQGFEVNYATLFARPTPLEGGEAGMQNWIAMFGNSIMGLIAENYQAEIIEKIENKLRSKLYQEGTWFADYRRIRIVAKKKI